MVPGTPSTIICARCGWQNDSTARMCGGCGTPLHTSDPGATNQADTSSLDAPTVASPNVPGAYVAQPYAQPVTPPAIPQMPTPVTAAAPSAWPAPGQGKARSGRTFQWWIIPLVILVAILVLSGLGFGVWSFGIQPSTTSNINSTFPAVLNPTVNAVNTGLPLLENNGQVRIAAPAIDLLIKAESPHSGPLTNFDFSFITVPYVGFKLTYDFNFFGTELQDTTAALSIEQGSLAARSTVVDGSMSLFESGDQMEQILNNALARLTTIQGKIVSIQLTGEILTIQLMHS